MEITEAIILAGGLGTRLRSEVPDLPKCLAPVAGKPFLDYVIRYYTAQGIRRFIFSLGYRADMILDYLRREHTTLSYTSAVEPEPLGTGGAIRKALELAKTDHVLVLNGDTLFRIDLGELQQHHFQQPSDCSLCLKPMTEFDRYGVVELHPDHRIRSFHEKRYYASGWINGGVYALNRLKFLREDFPEKFSFEKDYLEKFYAVRVITGLVQQGYFIDIGIPEDFQKAQTELPLL